MMKMMMMMLLDCWALAFSSGGSKRKSADFGGANSVMVRPTPTWQKGLGNFLQKKMVEEEESGNTSEKGEHDVTSS